MGSVRFRGLALSVVLALFSQVLVDARSAGQPGVYKMVGKPAGVPDLKLRASERPEVPELIPLETDRSVEVEDAGSRAAVGRPVHPEDLPSAPERAVTIVSGRNGTTRVQRQTEQASPLLRRSKRQSLPSSCTYEYEQLTASTMCDYYDDPAAVDLGMSDTVKAGIVALHNEHRGLVNPTATNMVKTYWDENIAVIAQKYAMACPTDHDTNDQRMVPGYGIYIGQNLAWGFNDWDSAITAWYEEYMDFEYGNEPDTYVQPDEMIGHYTQEVNAHAIAIGCGWTSGCTASWGGTWNTFVCNYAYGNTDFVEPYVSGPSCEQCPNTCVDNLCDCGLKICFNGGTLDRSTCTCECAELYTGDQCEIVDCSIQDDTFNCGSFWPESYCDIYYNIPYSCPYMCGYCEENVACTGVNCINGGVLDTSSCTCSCTSQYTGSTCLVWSSSDIPDTCTLTCQNGGVLDTASCSCSCPADYQGDTCENYVPCGGMTCSNGGVLETSSCTCSCPSDWTGTYCETPVVCGGLTCYNGGILDTNSCTCSCTASWSGPTCLESACANIYCQNSGTLNLADCTCSCQEGYTGSYCQIYNPTDNCPNVDPWYCVECWPSSYCSQYTNVPAECPIMCGGCPAVCPGMTAEYCGDHGTINFDTCTCDCDSGYAGDQCQTLASCPATDGWYCGSDWPSTFCSVYTNVAEDCPIMCGVCPDVCPGLGAEYCKNDGVLNPANCQCDCTSGFTGTQCQTYVTCPYGADTWFCGGQWPASYCDLYSNVAPLCPYMCGICV